MFKWLAKKRDFNFAKKGSIGGTTEWFCMGYWSCIQSITLKEKWEGLHNPPESKADRTKELNNLFDFMLTARFQSLPNEYQESKTRNQELTRFGAFSFIASILKVEADLHLNLIESRVKNSIFPSVSSGGEAPTYGEYMIFDLKTERGNIKDGYNKIDMGIFRGDDFLTDKNVLLDDSWFAHDEKDVHAFHEFRHQIPILVNEKNAKDNREKIGTDMAVSDNYFDEMMRYYEKMLSDTGLPYVIFGHIGDNHLHINLLPDPSQKNIALALYDEIAKKIFSWNGTVSAEHGIGKKKKKYLFQMVGKSNMEDLKKIKNTLDPQNRLGAGNIF